MNRAATLAATLLLAFGWIPICATGKPDQHRPACSTAECRTIRATVKARYCGESPYGNGPNESCNIRAPKQLAAGTHVVADFKCEWNEKKQSSDCRQQNLPAPDVHALLVSEMKKLGAPASKTNDILFSVWQTKWGWSLSRADYSSVNGDNATECQVIGIIDRNSGFHSLRQVHCEVTDADVPQITTWEVLDIRDVNADGHPEIILQGDAYEDHWLEVVHVGDDYSFKTIFSGLGYYL